MAILEGIFKSSRVGKNHSRKNCSQLDKDASAIGVPVPVTYEIPHPLPQDNDGLYRHYHTSHCETLFSLNLHQRRAMISPSNPITSIAPGRPNSSYYPCGESRPYLPSSMSIPHPIMLSENIYDRAPPLTNSAPLHSTFVPLNSGYNPIAPPQTLAIHGVRFSESSNGIQYPLESLTIQNHPTSYVRIA